MTSRKRQQNLLGPRDDFGTERSPSSAPPKGHAIGVHHASLSYQAAGSSDFLGRGCGAGHSIRQAARKVHACNRTTLIVTSCFAGLRCSSTSSPVQSLPYSACGTSQQCLGLKSDIQSHLS